MVAGRWIFSVDYGDTFLIRITLFESGIIKKIPKIDNFQSRAFIEKRFKWLTKYTFRHIEYPTYTAVSVMEMNFER